MKILAIFILIIDFFCVNTYAAKNQSTQQPTYKEQSVQSETSETMTNKTGGEAFLAANKTKPGVITLPDGLQYKVIEEGTGAYPTKNDSVTVDYAGKLTNGIEFDSSYKRGKPVTFPVSGVIAGWVEALQLMKEGATWELYIPSTLAYGERGAPPLIGSNETLIFKVHLIKIQQ